jgi:hypothetical protein
MLVPLCILETDLGQVIATLREWLVPVMSTPCSWHTLQEYVKLVHSH